MQDNKVYPVHLKTLLTLINLRIPLGWAFAVIASMDLVTDIVIIGMVINTIAIAIGTITIDMVTIITVDIHFIIDSHPSHYHMDYILIDLNLHSFIVAIPHINHQVILIHMDLSVRYNFHYFRLYSFLIFDI